MSADANDPHALTPGELAYAQSGGDDAGLVKEGLVTPDNGGAQQQQPQERQTEQQPAQQPEPQQQSADDDDEPDLDPKTGRPKQRGKWVSKKALDEERGERQRLSRELNTTKEQWARLEERFKVFQEALTAPEPREEEPEPDLPDPEQDIIGFNRGLAQRLDKRFSQLSEALGGLDQRFNQLGEQNTADRNANSMLGAYQRDAASFTQRQSDFPDAYRFLIQSRNAELEAAGYDDPAERQRLIVADEQALVSRSLQNKRSPAESVYALAKARGYQVKAPSAAQNGNGGASNGNGTVNGAHGASTPQKSVTDEIARLQAGQDASLSLSNVGGSKPGALSIEDLINMPQDQFNAFARKNPHLLEAMAGKGQ